MRRRLREQKQIREALLLDLGALVYELHRHDRTGSELLQAKIAELSSVDQEVRALADALDADESELALVAAGILGSCAACGSLLSTEAHFCASCGTQAAGGASRPAERAASRGAAPARARPAFEAAEPVRDAHVDEQEHVEEPEREDAADTLDDEPLAPWLVGREAPGPRDG